jgi:two-component sensor histidine kinase
MLDRRLDLAPPGRWDAFRLTLVLWVAVLFVIAPATLFSGQVSNLPEFLSLFTGFAAALLFSTLLYGIVRLVSGRPLWFAIPAVFFGLTVTATLQMAGDYGGQFLLDATFPEHRMSDTSRQALMLTALIYWALSACNLVLLWIAGTWRRLRENEAALGQAQISALTAELGMLRMQLNPHFMCNSLNTVSSLILEGRHTEANRMAERLADFLRGVMDLKGEEIRLSDELRTIISYVDVEAARFGSRLDVSIGAEEETQDAAVPNFLLQPLVENALKYGVESVPGAVSLRIKAMRDARDLVLTVENEARAGAKAGGRPVQAEGHGIGLGNTRARLRMLFDDRGTLETQPFEHGFRATIRIPFTALPPLHGARSAAGKDMSMLH